MTNVLHLIDTLDAGGAERVAVNLANELALREYKVALCATRRSGSLLSLLTPNVKFICLNRRSRFDLPAVLHLVKFVKNQRVQIIHAHSSSLFIAILIKLFIPQVKIIWHDHFGGSAVQVRSPFIYGPFARYTDGIISVNQMLSQWAINELRMAPEKLWILPNFIQQMPVQAIDNLPGEPGFRLVCVANLRPQKDHITLIRAMKLVVEQEPRTHLILIGANNVPGIKEKMDSEILELGLIEKITWLGQRDDVQNILACCTIGVLSSASEGLPLALLDYGSAGLPVVVTEVGECAEVLDHGNAGTLVTPHSPKDLADGILFYLQNPELGKEVGMRFQVRVKNNYSAEVVLQQIENIYHQVLIQNEE
jgi:glycosyltransferase involved in cell wall biosynthesis